MKHWDRVVVPLASFTGHRARMKTQGHLREKQRRGLYPGLGYAEAPMSRCLAENLSSWATGLVYGRMKLFMVEMC